MKPRLAHVKRYVLPAVIAFATAFGLSQTDLLLRIEDATLDLRTRRRAEWRPVSPSGQVWLVAIDEFSVHDKQGFGRWPWKRSIHGDLLQLLSVVEPTGPSVVGWDILFSEPSPEDGDLAEGIRVSKLDVVFGAEKAKFALGVPPESEVAKNSRVRPLPPIEGDRARIPQHESMLLPAGELARLADVGFVTTPPSADGVRRHLPMVVRIGDQFYPSLSLQVLLRHWHASPEQVRVRLGDELTIETPAKLWRVPIDESGRYLVNYRYTIETYTKIGYKELFDRLKARYVDNDTKVTVPEIGDRVVLVGQAADGLSDLGPTPFSSLTPLVLVHANTIENILQQDYVRPVPLAPVWLGALLVGIAGMAVFSERNFREQAAFSLGIPLVYVTLATMTWVNYSLLFPLVGPLLGFVALQAYMIGRRVLTEQRAKEQIKGAFGTYLAPTVVERLAKSGEMPRLGGHEEEITAYFSDIQGYSTFSEKLSAAQLVELLNDYLTACTDTITEEGGTLDKYIGDAVVAMFGAPIHAPDHAYRACVAALRVQQQLGALRQHWNTQAERWPETVLKMQSRIGLNSGPAVIGNMGSRTRFNYTMTGDNVNLAARMESGAKTWGVYTMCTEATKRACEQHGGDGVVFRLLGRTVVQGRSQAVPVHELVTLSDNLTDRTRECLAVFAEGLERFWARDWAGARERFRLSAALEPNQPGTTPGVKSNPSLAYLDRILPRLEAQPPGEDWDGVHHMTEK